MHIDESKKFDKRTMERNLKEGIVSANEWEQFLKRLPDVSDKAELAMSEEEQQREEGEIIKDKKRKSKESVGEETTPEKK